MSDSGGNGDQQFCRVVVTWLMALFAASVLLLIFNEFWQLGETVFRVCLVTFYWTYLVVIPPLVWTFACERLRGTNQ